MAAVRRLSNLIRAKREQASERAAHDDAMRDPGVAQDHASSISRAVSRGEPGCSFCA